MSRSSARVGNPRRDLREDMHGNLRPVELDVVELDQLFNDRKSLGMQLFNGVGARHKTRDILAGGNPTSSFFVPDGANHDGSKHETDVLQRMHRHYKVVMAGLLPMSR